MHSDYFITSERLGFRRWSKNDLDLAFKLWGSFEVTKLFDRGGPFSKEKVKSRLYQEIANQSEYGVQYWPIFLLDSGKHIGCAGLRPYDTGNNILEIGFHIRPEQWRKGYALEAARTVMAYAFIDLKANALFAGHNPMNSGSEKLLNKLGFKYTHDEFYKATGLEHPSYLLKSDEYDAHN